MTKERFIKTLVVITLNFCIIAGFYSSTTVSAAYRQGSQGNTVKQIQQKLKNWSYYSGSVDGVFGNETRQAVVKFQKKNGLNADGVVGKKTLSAMGINEKNAGSSNNGGSVATSNDLYLLSRMISAEARGEPYEGQVAVGAVILNRVDHPSFPNTLSGVLYQPGAFSALNDGQYDQPIADISRKAAKDALNGMDPSGGAIYYYNPVKSTNKWIFSRPTICTIGKHIFAK